MLMELIIFAIVLAALQTLVLVIGFKLLTSKWYMRKLCKMSKELTKELLDDMDLL